MRTLDDLKQLQALPLSLKVALTKQRLRQWVNEFGVDGVFVAFSGGKDSTVLLDIARGMYPDIPAVFVNTGLEYPEIVQFVKTFDNVEIIRPKMNFKKVVEKWGYPFISKEVSERVYYGQIFAKKHGYTELSEEFFEHVKRLEKGGYKLKQLCGIDPRKDRDTTTFTFKKWVWLSFAPFRISNKCCQVMKKNPAHEYQQRTGRKCITAQMADESHLRTVNWLTHGCNGFDMKTPISNPMSFWREQDVLQYIRKNGLKICSLYGDIVADEEKSDNCDGQLRLNLDGTIEETECVLKTTGCKRTGCMFCGFGCHLEKPGEERFLRMKTTHPKLYEWIMKPWNDGGLGYKDVIDWLNENGGLNIRY